MEHNKTIGQYLKYFEVCPLYQYFKQWNLLQEFSITSIRAGSICNLSQNSFVFNVKGLLKQLKKIEESKTDFIQFLMPDICWKFEPFSGISSTTYLALQHSIILHIPLEKINPFLLKNKRSEIEFKDILTMDYESGLSLSYFLLEQVNPLYRFNQLCDIYGEYLHYMNPNELGKYINIKNNKASYLIYLLKSNRLVDMEVIEQQFTK